MKSFAESILSFKCTSCGVNIYNATKEEYICERCGHKLIRIGGVIKEDEED